MVLAFLTSLSTATGRCFTVTDLSVAPSTSVFTTPRVEAWYKTAPIELPAALVCNTTGVAVTERLLATEPTTPEERLGPPELNDVLAAVRLESEVTETAQKLN